MAAVEQEIADVDTLLSNPISQSVSLVKLWSDGDVQRKQDLQRALFPKGAAYNPSHFGWFCTRNSMLMQALAELGSATSNVGVLITDHFEHLGATIAEATPLYELCASVLEA